MCKFIITGATGFIGSNLCKRLLKENHEVAIICRKNSNLNTLKDVLDRIEVFYYESNLQDMINFFTIIKPDAVFHIAGLIITEHKPSDISILIDSNIKFSTQILEAMSISGVKYIINTGTCLQHYNNANYNPSCLYAATKQAFDDILKYYVESYNFKSITLTLFNVYGENDLSNRLLNKLNYAAITNCELKMSCGYQKIDLIYIDDVINAYIHSYHLLKDDPAINNQCYAICTERLVTLRDLVSIYEKENKVKLNIKWCDKDYRFREVFIPWSSYTLLPGWKSKVSLEEGIKKFQN